MVTAIQSYILEVYITKQTNKLINKTTEEEEVITHMHKNTKKKYSE